MKKSISSLSMVTVVLFLFLAGCSGSGSSSAGGGAAAKYMPHTTGSTWNYSSVSSYATYTFTVSITSSSDTAYTQKYTSSLDSEYSISNYVFSNNVWGQSEATDYASDGVLISSTTWTPPCPLSFPSKIDAGTNEHYLLTVDSGTAKSATMDITVIGYENVTVPAGTFNNAVKISYTYVLTGSVFAPVATWTSWFAEGVGLIKTVYDGETEELTSYSIK